MKYLYSILYEINVRQKNKSDMIDNYDSLKLSEISEIEKIISDNLRKKIDKNKISFENISLSIPDEKYLYDVRYIIDAENLNDYEKEFILSITNNKWFTKENDNLNTIITKEDLNKVDMSENYNIEIFIKYLTIYNIE